MGSSLLLLPRIDLFCSSIFFLFFFFFPVPRALIFISSYSIFSMLVISFPCLSLSCYTILLFFLTQFFMVFLFFFTHFSWFYYSSHYCVLLYYNNVLTLLSSVTQSSLPFIILSGRRTWCTYISA